jgi:phosphate starvation-inducible PhoH-like protein
MVAYIIVALAAYLIGSISFSIIISKKMAGFDVREKGSGNAGATNMLRSVGKKAAALTLLGDALKGVVAIGFAVIVGALVKNVDKALKLMNELQLTVSNGKNLDKQSITYSLHLLLEGSEEKIKELEDTIVVTKKGKAVQPKTLGQKKYLDLIKSNDITFGIGPAGTGKTYLAVAMAVRAFKRDEVSRIILTRPAVEAGESLGFLPGDLKDKVDPYLRPLYDALFDMLGEEKFNKYLERGLIEVAPLAFMRGRTLDNAFIILDEAQNTTKEQMKMFLTRLGFGSKAVVTGDLTQIDLPKNSKSGLIHATEVLKDVEGIGTMFLTQRDVVRHELVQRIIIAYEKYDNKKEYNKLDKK